MTEDDEDRSWERIKVLKYCEEKEFDGRTSCIYLVIWNDMNKSESWFYFFALSLINLIHIITFAKKND
jgi:hypothetical protein